MSHSTNTKPRAQRIDSQAEALAAPPVKTAPHAQAEPIQPPPPLA